MQISKKTKQINIAYHALQYETIENIRKQK